MYVYIMCTFFQSKSCIFIYLSIIPFNETREKDRGRERQRETERRQRDDWYTYTVNHNLLTKLIHIKYTHTNILTFLNFLLILTSGIYKEDER